MSASAELRIAEISARIQKAKRLLEQCADEAREAKVQVDGPKLGSVQAHKLELVGLGMGVACPRCFKRLVRNYDELYCFNCGTISGDNSPESYPASSPVRATRTGTSHERKPHEPWEPDLSKKASVRIIEMANDLWPAGNYPRGANTQIAEELCFSREYVRLVLKAYSAKMGW